ncbi:urate oxidase UaZ [Patellaria atrata CBS 101060]|uniref:Uricase n=1 Tax=Patellaria atrata CBS 101060 TaxID=1346257 RepID=A0A9P4VTM6_9PEZI|nr:urate oxidase UaZ [Patellaria atrata CBS 101060]
MPAQLSSARYGKSNVRILKRELHPDGTQSVVEMTVESLLEGDIETSYTKADNSVIVATDTQKQTAYITAKQNPVTPPELYAAILANHYVTTYNHIHAAHITVVVHKWTRMTVDGKPHPHSFLRDGSEKRTVYALAREGKGISIKSGLKGLLVLKSTGSAFYGFHRDEYTQLPETWDRILSTEVDAAWQWKMFPSIPAVKDAVAKFDPAFQSVTKITTDTFAKDNSASVQNTMYKMSDQILEAVPLVESVDYSLPNKHYFEIDLSWHRGIKNTGKNATVYAPQSDPNGLIECTVSRSPKSKL